MVFTSQAFRTPRCAHLFLEAGKPRENGVLFFCDRCKKEILVPLSADDNN